MSGRLGAFQDGFVQALFAPADAAARLLPGLASQPGFAVYRNTVHKACIDALAANHPAVCRLVGDAWFRAAAALFVGTHPPQDPRLHEYGAGFATFLRGFDPAADWPWLADVARLDRCWVEAHVAADAPRLEGAAVARLAPEHLARAVLKPHSAARWAWFGDHPVYTLWRAQREAGEGVPVDLGDVVWQGEGALVTRPDDAVVWHPLDAAGCAFLDACAAGRDLAAAAQAALETGPETDLAGLMAHLLRAGAFSELREDPT